MKKSEIKTIIFDVGGVLALPNLPMSLIQDTHLGGVPAHCGHRNKGVHEYIADKLKIFLDQWFDSIDTIYAKSIEGRITKEQLLETLSSNLNISKKKIQNLVVKAYKLNFKQNKQLFKQAFKLKKQGYKMGVLSDQWHLSQEALMPNRLYKKFNAVVVSTDVGIRKPNPKIYKLVLKKLNSKPPETLFIDNQQWNITPAKKIGMKTILFKNNEQLFENKTWKSLFKK